MYTVNMADSTGLFIVFMIFCVMSITSSILLTYTCTDGTWDFDNFEGKQCVKFPEEDKTDPACSTFTTDSDCPIRCSWDTTTSSCDEPPSSYNNPSNVTYGYGTYTSSLLNGAVILPKSEHFTTCSTMFFIDETKTCFNKNNNSAAIKWVITNTDNTNTCLSKISYFRVYVSFSVNNDALYYVDKAVSDRHFHFKGSPSDTLMSEGGDNTITFTVHAMDINNKILASAGKKSVTANDAADTCTNMGVGAAENWSDVMNPYVITNNTPLPQPVVGCIGKSGATPPADSDYEIDYDFGCRINATGDRIEVAEAMTLTGSPCTIQKTLIPGYTPATGGGACVAIKREIFSERKSGLTPDSDEDKIAVECAHSLYWEPQSAVGTEYGPEKYQKTDGDGLGTCSKACGPGGKQRQVQPVTQASQNLSGITCADNVRFVDCNTGTTCGRDCKGTMFTEDHDKDNKTCVIKPCSYDCVGRSGGRSYSATNSVRTFKTNIEQIVGPIVTNEVFGTVRPSKSCEERYGDNTKRFEGKYEENFDRSGEPDMGWHSCQCKDRTSNGCSASKYSSFTGYSTTGVADQAGTLNSF